MTYANLTRWKTPNSYFGAEWPEYYVFLSQHRDSDALTRSNFICGLEAIGGGASETVHVVREGHWAVGWVEWIAIHESDLAALAKADKLLDDLDDYPVLNEEHFSDLEYTEAERYWASLSVRESMELCAEHKLSIFAARRDYLPHDDSGMLVDYLRG
jgi:hypothetical protein